MANYLHLSFQDNMKDQHAGRKLRSLERRCSGQVERLKLALGDHLQHGVPNADIWGKTLSFFTVKKALIFHNGYSRCSRDVLRLSPVPAEDVTPLCCQQ